MFVQELIMSCQVSENPNNGPVQAQMSTSTIEASEVAGRHAARVIAFEIFSNDRESFPFFFFVLSRSAVPSNCGSLFIPRHDYLL